MGVTEEGGFLARLKVDATCNLAQSSVLEHPRQMTLKRPLTETVEGSNVTNVAQRRKLPMARSVGGGTSPVARVAPEQATTTAANKEPEHRSTSIAQADATEAEGLRALLSLSFEPPPVPTHLPEPSPPTGAGMHALGMRGMAGSEEPGTCYSMSPRDNDNDANSKSEADELLTPNSSSHTVPPAPPGPTPPQAGRGGPRQSPSPHANDPETGWIPICVKVQGKPAKTKSAPVGRPKGPQHKLQDPIGSPIGLDVTRHAAPRSSTPAAPAYAASALAWDALCIRNEENRYSYSGAPATPGRNALRCGSCRHWIFADELSPDLLPQGFLPFQRNFVFSCAHCPGWQHPRSKSTSGSDKNAALEQEMPSRGANFFQPVPLESRVGVESFKLTKPFKFEAIVDVMLNLEAETGRAEFKANEISRYRHKHWHALMPGWDINTTPFKVNPELTKRGTKMKNPPKDGLICFESVESKHRLIRAHSRQPWRAIVAPPRNPDAHSQTAEHGSSGSTSITAGASGGHAAAAAAATPIGHGVGNRSGGAAAMSMASAQASLPLPRPSQAQVAPAGGGGCL